MLLNKYFQLRAPVSFARANWMVSQNHLNIPFLILISDCCFCCCSGCYCVDDDITVVGGVDDVIVVAVAVVVVVKSDINEWPGHYVMAFFQKKILSIFKRMEKAINLVRRNRVQDEEDIE